MYVVLHLHDKLTENGPVAGSSQYFMVTMIGFDENRLNVKTIYIDGVNLSKTREICSLIFKKAHPLSLDKNVGEDFKAVKFSSFDRNFFRFILMNVKPFPFSSLFQNTYLQLAIKSCAQSHTVRTLGRYVA